MSVWSVWTSAKSERSARKVLQRLEERLGRETVATTFEPYPKIGGSRSGEGRIERLAGEDGLEGGQQRLALLAHGR